MENIRVALDIIPTKIEVAVKIEVEAKIEVIVKIEVTAKIEFAAEIKVAAKIEDAVKTEVAAKTEAVAMIEIIIMIEIITMIWGIAMVEEEKDEIDTRRKTKFAMTGKILEDADLGMIVNSLINILIEVLDMLSAYKIICMTRTYFKFYFPELHSIQQNLKYQFNIWQNIILHHVLF